MSDLQCACTMLVTPYGTGDLAARVRERRVAAVFSGSSANVVQAARLAAAELGVPFSTSEALDALPGADEAGEPAGPYPFAEALDAIADLHRGETVLVVGEAGVVAVELLVDGDGWVRTNGMSAG